jgi:hypothetical protein
VIEGNDFDDGQGGGRDEVFVVEEDEGEPGLAGGGLLGEKEVVEAVNGGVGDAAHGAGTIEDKGEFGEVWIHDAPILPKGVGQRLSEGEKNRRGREIKIKIRIRIKNPARER